MCATRTRGGVMTLPKFLFWYRLDPRPAPKWVILVPLATAILTYEVAAEFVVSFMLWVVSIVGIFLGLVWVACYRAEQEEKEQDREYLRMKGLDQQEVWPRR